MKKVFLNCCLLIVPLLVFMACSFDVAAEITPEQKAGRKAVEKGLEDSLGMPILRRSGKR